MKVHSLTLLEIVRAALFPSKIAQKTACLPWFCGKKQLCGLTSLICSDVAAVNNVFIAGIHTEDYDQNTINHAVTTETGLSVIQFFERE